LPRSVGLACPIALAKAAIATLVSARRLKDAMAAPAKKRRELRAECAMPSSIRAARISARTESAAHARPRSSVSGSTPRHIAVQARGVRASGAVPSNSVLWQEMPARIWCARDGPTRATDVKRTGRSAPHVRRWVSHEGACRDAMHRAARARVCSTVLGPAGAGRALKVTHGGYVDPPANDCAAEFGASIAYTEEGLR